MCYLDRWIVIGPQRIYFLLAGVDPIIPIDVYLVRRTDSYSIVDLIKKIPFCSMNLEGDRWY